MVDVVFYKGNDLLAKGIKWWTGGRFSHCGFLINQVLVVDTDLIHGLRVRWLTWQPEDYEVVPVKIAVHIVLCRLFANRHRKYDLIEGFRRVLPFIKDRQYLWNCAESVYDTLYPEGTERCLYPDDLYNMLKGGSYEIRRNQ